MWTWVEILETNRTLSGSSPQVEYLLDRGIASQCMLLEAANVLEAMDTPHVAAFCQLPYPIFVQDQWYSVRSLDKGLKVRLKAAPKELTIDDSLGLLRARLASVQENTKNAANISQITVLVPIWGKRLDFYDRYVDLSQRSERSSATIVPIEHSWIPGRSINVFDYELSIYARYRQILLAALRDFLPAYSLISLSEAVVFDRLFGYFVMPAPGRVYFGSKPLSILPKLVARTNETLACASGPSIESALTVPFRELSAFERQLIALNRLRTEGEFALSLIGCLALLEWFLNKKIIYARKSTINTNDIALKRQFYLSQIITSSKTAFIPDNLRQVILDAVKIRNRIVHGAPQPRASLTQPTSDLRRAESSNFGSLVASKQAEEVIMATLEIYRFVNKSIDDQSGLLSQFA